MGLVGHLDHRITNPQPRPGRQIVRGQRKIYRQLVAGQRTPLGIRGDQCQKSAVDEVQLHIGMWTAVSGEAARPLAPIVPDQAFGYVQFSLGEYFSHVDVWSPHD